MLSTQNIFSSTVCIILFIAVISSTPVDMEQLMFGPVSYPKDGFINPINVYEYLESKTKRQTTSDVLRYDEEDLLGQNLPFGSKTLKELLQALKKPKKSSIFTLNGWSASGMPFNVLYTPNMAQQKFLTAANAMEENKPSMQIPIPLPLRRENPMAQRKQDKEYVRVSGAKTSAKSHQMRRHYLVIPQLFVSYGWGSVGK